MNIPKIFDAYSLRARFYPAVIAAAPGLGAVVLLISWNSINVSNVFATIAIVVLHFAMADYIRFRGRAIEPKVFSKLGGMPSIIMLRRNDPSIDEGMKARFRVFLGQKLGVEVPNAETENANQAIADSFYDKCCIWLRENTRDVKKYHLLFNENVTYGFRRNLLGVKWLAIGLNFVVVSLCAVLLWRANWNIQSDFSQRIIVVLIISFFHAVFFSFAVNMAAVFDAAKAYARELILSCESFIRTPDSTKTAAKSARKSG